MYFSNSTCYLILNLLLLIVKGLCVHYNLHQLYDHIHIIFLEGCSNVYTAASGTVMSPNYPNNYPNSRVCKSKIRVANGFRVQLNFSEIDIESHGTCSFDSLSIYNGPDETAPLLGRYCDRHAASTLTSSSNEVLIVFKSDISNTGRGFRANYNSISGGKRLHFIHIVIAEKLNEAIILNEESRLGCSDVTTAELNNSRKKCGPPYSLIFSFFLKNPMIFLLQNYFLRRPCVTTFQFTEKFC